MATVSDTSPLIAFSRINQLDLLQSWALRITVPDAVARELRDGARPGEPIIAALDEGSWLTTVSVVDLRLVRSLREELDEGEAEAIALAVELRATLLIDDRLGRQAAARFRLEYAGTLGILSRAKRSGLLARVAPVTQALADSGIFYAPSLLDKFLRSEGE